MSVFNKVENAKAEIKVTIDNDTWKGAQDKAFKKLAKKVEIKGFRKGQAPRNLVARQIAKESVYLEAVEDLAQGELVKAIAEHKVELIDRPELKIDHLDDDKCELTFVCPIKPDVTLGQYKDLGYKVTKPRISAKDIEAKIKELQERKADLELKEDGEVVDGDTVVIDFEGFKDGVAFEGGKGENYNLVIGSHSFIPGFEEQLIGMKPEEERDIEVTFPEDYHAEDLKGQKAVFKVKVHEIKTKVLPEVDAEFIESLGYENVKTEEELKAHIKDNLAKERLSENETKATNELLDKLVANATVEVPEVMVKDEKEEMFNEQARTYMQYGIDLNTVLKSSGSDKETYLEGFSEEALKRVKIRLVLEKIAEVENIEITEKDIDNEYAKMAENYQMDVNEIKKHVSPEAIKYDLRLSKALEVAKS